MSLGGEFSRAVDNVDPNPSGAAQEAQKSLLACISNVSTNVAVDVSQKVDPSKPGAQCLANNLKGGAEAAQTQLRGQIQAVSEDIAAAQTEIMHAVKAAGIQVTDVASPKPSDSSSPSAAIISAALSSKAGGGSFATFKQAYDSLASARDIALDRNSTSSEKAAAVAEILTAASSGPSLAEMQRADFGHLQQADAPADMGRGTAVDWKSVFAGTSSEEQLEIIEAIMTIDPNDPSPVHFPELAAMVEADGQIDDYLAELDQAIEKANQMGTPEYCSEEVLYMVQLDRGMAGLNVDKVVPGSPEYETVKDSLSVSEQWEVDRAMELAEMQRRINPGMSGMAAA